MHHNGSNGYHLPPSSLLATSDTLETLRDKIFYSRRLERMWEFIEESYSDSDIRLGDAARRSGVSPDHLNLLLRRFGDTTFLVARWNNQTNPAARIEGRITFDMPGPCRSW